LLLLLLLWWWWCASSQNLLWGTAGSLNDYLRDGSGGAVVLDEASSVLRDVSTSLSTFTASCNSGAWARAALDASGIREEAYTFK
jgi:hypothetical protein